MTFTLLTTNDGRKMGKTEKGALWLDPEKTSPYEFYQYWRNVNDADVIKCLKLLTFLPLEEIDKLAELKDKEINQAKKVLAYEVTKLVHGEEEAIKAQQAAEALFGGTGTAQNIPTTEITGKELGDGINVLDLLIQTNLIPSKGEVRRLITQGGLYINDERVEAVDLIIKPEDFKENELIIRKGKKTYHKVILNK